MKSADKLMDEYVVACRLCGEVWEDFKASLKSDVICGNVISKKKSDFMDAASVCSEAYWAWRGAFSAEFRADPIH